MDAIYDMSGGPRSDESYELCCAASRPLEEAIYVGSAEPPVIASCALCLSASPVYVGSVGLHCDGAV